MFFTLFYFFDPTANFWRSAIAWYLIPKFLVLAFKSTTSDAHSESASINKKEPDLDISYIQSRV